VKGLSSMQLNGLEKEQVKELLSNLQLMNSAEVARYIGWSVNKVSVYNERGILPEPVCFIGGRPIWTKEEIESFKKGGNK
jgi:hypothetical protein